MGLNVAFLVKKKKDNNKMLITTNENATEYEWYITIYIYIQMQE